MSAQHYLIHSSCSPELSIMFDRVSILFPWKLLCCLFCIRLSLASDPPGIKRMLDHPLPLPPSGFSASSVYKNQPDSQAHKANLHVFAPQDQPSGAWCPAQPVQSQLTEWLQIEFDNLKIMRVLFTEGRGNNQNFYGLAFVLRYQRQNGQRWYDYRMRNGTKLLHAILNGQTVAITLDPPVVAKRFRVYPYSELEPRFICLRLAFYGWPFDDGVVEYAIPEGGIYRMDPRIHVSLNDTTYDGSWIFPAPVNDHLVTTSSSVDRRAYFYGGLGLLMDKQFYEGQLPEPGDNHSVIGWFRRQHSTPSDQISMLFTFDQVRNFSQLRIHALNSLNYVALFRRVWIQFSLAGRHFDRRSTPVLLDVPRDTQNRQARWISIELGHRIGRFVRVTLLFDYDWIVLSEVTFTSVPLPNVTSLPVEKSSDPVYKLPDLDLPDGDQMEVWQNEVSGSNRMNMNTNSDESSLRIASSALSQRGLAHSQDIGQSEQLMGDVSVSPALKTRSSNTPYIIAILCCCLGSVVFASLFAFMVYRVRQHRRRRLKKLRKGQLQQTDSAKQQQQQQHQLLLANSHNQQSNANSTAFFQPSVVSSAFMPTSSPAGLVMSDSVLTSLFSNSFPYNQLKTTATAPGGGTTFGHTTGLLKSADHHNTKTSDPLLAATPFHNLGSPCFAHSMTDSTAPPNYKQYAPGLDHDGLLALQLLQQSSNPGSNFHSLGGLTLARRGVPDTSAAFPSYPTPFVSIPPCGLYNLALSQSTASAITTTNNAVSKLAFCPPPPDQPLPPLPPPSASPDSTQPHPHRAFIDCVSVGTLLTGTSPMTPYVTTASLPAHCSPAFSPESGLILPLGADGSMPEYASASLFSTNSSIPPSPGHPSYNGLTNCRPPSYNDLEGTKFRAAGETYCVPHHQNGIHPHLMGLWSTNLNRPTPNTTTLSTLQGTNSDCQTGSLDSSGMYYLANAGDSVQLEVNTLSVQDPGLRSRGALFLPFPPVSQHLVPITLFSGQQQPELFNRFHTYQSDTVDPQSRMDDLAMNGNGLFNCSQIPYSFAAVNGKEVCSRVTMAESELPVGESVS
ncbi:hypothetical protein EG68_00033 [Paragonimus skrjabini miyazakii]|uniref:F5/8 type C domain-containing protein n=1 Tax=Paragonimus skrjabini miyazakii TaxID=59628 RepID=A0A8S9ZAZ1_9TREM|nr:hypothetical protein EG68_00033 [Paragonimus skrjabini miyazakii]